MAGTPALQRASARDSVRVIARAMVVTSGASTGTWRRSGVVTTETLATAVRPAKIGAATDAVPSDISSRDTANPVARICDTARRKVASSVIVSGVRGAR